MNSIFPVTWEFHNPNWRAPSFSRGVGIPPTSSGFLGNHWVFRILLCLPQGNSFCSRNWRLDLSFQQHGDSICNHYWTSTNSGFKQKPLESSPPKKCYLEHGITWMSSHQAWLGKPQFRQHGNHENIFCRNLSLRQKGGPKDNLGWWINKWIIYIYNITIVYIYIYYMCVYYIIIYIYIYAYI